MMKKTFLSFSFVLILSACTGFTKYDPYEAQLINEIRYDAENIVCENLNKTQIGRMYSNSIKLSLHTEFIQNNDKLHTLSLELEHLIGEWVERDRASKVYCHIKQGNVIEAARQVQMAIVAKER